MIDLKNLSDTELFYSVGSHRPERGSLGDLIRPMTDVELLLEQKKYDEAIAEMRRRHKEGWFPYWIPGGDE